MTTIKMCFDFVKHYTQLYIDPYYTQINVFINRHIIKTSNGANNSRLSKFNT